MRAFPAKRLLKKFVEFRGDADKTRRRFRGIKAPDFWTAWFSSVTPPAPPHMAAALRQTQQRLAGADQVSAKNNP